MYLRNRLCIRRNYFSKFFFFAKLRDGFILDILWTTIIYSKKYIKHWNNYQPQSIRGSK